MRTKHNIIGVGLVVALSLGGVAVPASASVAAPATVSATAAATTASVPGAPHRIGAVLPTPKSSAPVQTGSTADRDQRSIASIFIKAVKKYGASAYNAMVRSLKSSRSSFKRWFNTMPGWVKVATGSIGADALYDLLKSALGL